MRSRSVLPQPPQPRRKPPSQHLQPQPCRLPRWLRWRQQLLLPLLWWLLQRRPHHPFRELHVRLGRRHAPILTSIDVALVGPEARNTSSRVITSLTGRPALRDSASATGSAHTWVLPPKPPPISEEVTRNREASMPSS